MHTVKEVRTIDSSTLTLSLPASFLKKQVEITVKAIPTSSRRKSKLAKILEHPVKIKSLKKFSREELHERESIR